MAKLGEGDARWIVAEREDGTNVKGWHWVEKDAMEWTRSRLGELLGDKTLADADGVTVRTAPALLACTGEAYVNRRKGKIIPGFELAVKVAWVRFHEDCCVSALAYPASRRRAPLPARPPRA
jgi:activator of HSP90 ATPase